MHNSDTEHVHTIYCDADYSGSLLGGGATARIMDIEAVVGAGGDKLGWDTAGKGIGDGGGI